MKFLSNFAWFIALGAIVLLALLKDSTGKEINSLQSRLTSTGSALIEIKANLVDPESDFETREERRWEWKKNGRFPDQNRRNVSKTTSGSNGNRFIAPGA